MLFMFKKAQLFDIVAQLYCGYGFLTVQLEVPHFQGLIFNSRRDEPLACYLQIVDTAVVNVVEASDGGAGTQIIKIERAVKTAAHVDIWVPVVACRAQNMILWALRIRELLIAVLYTYKLRKCVVRVELVEAVRFV